MGTNDLFGGGKKRTKTREISPDGKRVTVTKSVSKSLGNGTTMTKEKTVDRRRVGNILLGEDFIAKNPEDKRKVQKTVTISKNKGDVSSKAEKRFNDLYTQKGSEDKKNQLRKATEMISSGKYNAVEFDKEGNMTKSVLSPQGIKEKAKAYGKNAASELFNKKQMN